MMFYFSAQYLSLTLTCFLFEVKYDRWSVINKLNTKKSKSRNQTLFCFNEWIQKLWTLKAKANIYSSDISHQIQKCFSVTSSTPTWYKILACQQLKMKMKLKFEFSTLRCLPMIWIMKEAKTTAQPQPPSGGGTDWDEEELCCWADSDQSEISIYCVNQSEISIYCVNQSDIISFYVNQ